MTHACFRKHKSTVFTVCTGGRRFELELVLVKSRHTGHRQGGAFSLILHGPAEPELKQDVYRIEHAVLGAHSLFMVPVDRDQRNTAYEICFN